MKKYSLLAVALFLLGACNAQDPSPGGSVFEQKHASNSVFENAEQKELIFYNWATMMKDVQAENKSSDADFEAFEQFDANPLVLAKSGFFKECLTDWNYNMNLVIDYTVAKWEVEKLYKKFDETKKLYPTSVAETVHPHFMPSANACDSTGCTNIGFENGNFSGWYGYYASNTSTFTSFNVSGITGGALGAVTQAADDANVTTYTAQPHDYQLSITSGGYDKVAPTIPRVSPWGGSHSVMLGDSQIMYFGVAILSKTFMVTSNNANLTYQYALIINNPGHIYYEQPFFTVTLLDDNGDTIPNCGQYRITSGYSMPGFDSVTYLGVKTYYKNWNMVNVPLQKYIGHCVTIVFEVADCGSGGHFGYAYIDASCSPPSVVTSSPTFCGQDSVELSAPPGSYSYAWTGPSNSIRGNPNQQNIWADSAGTYTVVCVPITGPSCADTLTITIGKSPGPPPHPSFTASNVCVGQPMNFVNTSTPIGGNFSWDFYNLGYYNDTNVKNPTWTYTQPGTYTVKLNEIFNGCGVDTLIKVKVDSIPVPGFTSSGACLGSAVTFTNTTKSASTYLWNFGDPSSAPNDTSTTISPAHTYTAVGTYTVTLIATSNCPDTIQHVITISAPPKPIITGDDTICNGQTDTLHVTGGATYIWTINGSTNNYIAGKPTVTTNYIVRAFNGGCEHDTSFKVVVLPAVSFSVTALPTTILSGDSSTLTAISNVPTTYSWSPAGSVRNPNSSSTEAIPTSTTTYTCTAITLCGIYIDTVTVKVVTCFNNYNEPICIATVDTATNKAEVVWGRTNSPPQGGSGHYTVYKDSALAYRKTHTQPLNVLSEFLDQNSNPSAGPVSYELTTTDSCTESALSLPHTTMFLTTTYSTNLYTLNWTAYVGFSPLKYRIFRGLSMSTLVQVDSVANTVLTYSDTLAPIGSIYLVEAVNPSGTCVPSTIIKGHNVAANPLGISISNAFNTAILGVTNIGSSLSNVKIYPNPSNGTFNLSYSLTNSGNVSIAIIDELGQIVFASSEQRNSGQTNEQINMENLSAGIYSLRLQTSSGIMVKKLVVMKR